MMYCLTLEKSLKLPKQENAITDYVELPQSHIHHNTHTPHYITNIALNVVTIGTELAPNNCASSTKLLIEATTEKPGWQTYSN